MARRILFSCENSINTTAKLLFEIAFLMTFFSGNISLFAQDNSFIKNFPPNLYKASPAVFNITKDHENILYFGTNKGVVVFDGARWETISISNFSEAKTLELGPDSLIYVGANGNFGYLEHDLLDGLHYISISDSLPPFSTNFNDIWQIVFLNNKIYFQSYAGIFTWDGEELIFNKIEDIYIFAINGVLYGSSFSTGEFGKIVNGKIDPIHPFPEIQYDFVFQIFDYNDSTKLLTTSESGMYLFSPESETVTEFNSDLVAKFKKYNFYDGLKLDDNYYAMGTFNGGIFFMNQNGHLISALNKENGLFANHIYDMKLDKNNNLWLATSFGVSKILLDSLNVHLHNTSSEPSKALLRSVNFNVLNQNVKLALNNREVTVVEPSYALLDNRLDIQVLPSSLSFYFAQPDFAGDDIYYAVFLQGYDKDWSEWKPEAVKEYTNLPGGKYTFYIKAKNNLTGEIGEHESFQVNIFLPWHQSNWIKVIILLIIVSIVYVIVRLMILRLKTQNSRLEKIVNDRTLDLVEQKEKLSRLNKNLSATNKELDSFVYHTSHDLKAPLKSILGLVNLAKIDDQDKKFFEYHDRIEQSIHKLEEFISSIIQFSTNSKSRIEPVIIDFQKLVENSINELQFHEHFDNIIITQNIQPNGMYVSDEKRIQIILNNLMSNAIKYCDQNKNSKTIKIEIGHDHNIVKIIIEDNGIGISDKSQEKVFSMFYRDSEKSYGSGLGLYIIKETVKKLGGTIKIESMEGQFTRFIVELPNQSAEVPV